MMRLIDADELRNFIKSQYFKCDMPEEWGNGVMWATSQINHYCNKADAPTIETKQIKYFDEDEKVWKIGEVIVTEHKTEPTGYNLSPVDKDINVRSKTEPQTETKTETQNSNLTFKTLEYCDICDHKGCKECISNALDEYCVPSHYHKVEDEPQTDGYISGEDFMKIFTDCPWK